jgi:hypothetical protein
MTGASDQNLFALPRSELNAFLFATVCVEASGMALSVLSAFARAGIDPWQEAGRLAQLPRAAAAVALTQRLGAMEYAVWQTRDPATVVERLVALLPAGRAVAPGLPGSPRSGRMFTEARLAIGLAILAGMLAIQTWSMSAPGRAVTGSKPVHCQSNGQIGQRAGVKSCNQQAP